jgi:hypothetical protein
VQERLAELQTEVAGATKITAQTLLAELESARKTATDLRQLSAAIRAIETKAKISGALIERVEVGGPGDFDNCNNAEAIVDELIKFSLNPYHDFRAEDRRALIEMFRRQTAETHEFLEAIKARPIISVQIDKPKQLTHGNGKARQ